VAIAVAIRDNLRAPNAVKLNLIMFPARKFVHLDAGFRMHRGGYLPSVDLAYETWGKPNSDGSNGVLLFTGLSPSAHAASSPNDPSPGWWEEMVGPGRPIDTRRFFVICVNSLGSCFGSTGPASVDPGTGEPYRLSFPVLTIEDIATAGYEVVKALGLLKLSSVVGASMGGMSALSFCTLYPKAAESIVAISTAARAEPFAIAIRSLQREIICKDKDWQDGNYDPECPPDTGMRLARKLGMISYRSAEEWLGRFGRERVSTRSGDGSSFGIDFEVESYLDSHARKFTGRFDPNCYLYLSRAMDLFDIAEHSGCVATELGKASLRRALVVGARSDFLFPPHQQKELADCLEGPGREVSFIELPSVQGHDSFLADMDRFRPVIAEFFDQS
jgi:homoserine O-acetyltransferase